VLPVASIDEGTFTVRVVTGAGNGRDVPGRAGVAVGVVGGPGVAVGPAGGSGVPVGVGGGAGVTVGPGGGATNPTPVRTTKASTAMVGCPFVPSTLIVIVRGLDVA
jgi:hypothetical protein